MGQPLWMDLREPLSGGIDQYANRVLRRFGVVRAPVPVEEIAAWMGVKITRQRPFDLSGMIESNPRGASITLNGDESEMRQRFTIAHEIGHLLLHPLGEMYRDKDFTGDAQETQANKFAAALLMPLWMVEAAAGSPERYSQGQLARIFNVSSEAMGYRLQQLAGHPMRWR